jgi:FixJ family two-component response regulator
MIDRLLRYPMTDSQQALDTARPVVFVIDDDESVRRGISRLLGATAFQSKMFPSANDFLATEPWTGIGCIVCALQMPGLDGLGLQGELARRNYSMPIVFIAGQGTRTLPLAITAMKQGAVDLLAKPLDDDRLLSAVATAIEKHREIKSTERERNDIRQKIRLLRPREEEIFRCVVAGMLNKQIANKLGIAEQTVKIHRGHLTRKLGARSIPDLVRLATKAGIEV